MIILIFLNVISRRTRGGKRERRILQQYPQTVRSALHFWFDGDPPYPRPSHGLHSGRRF